MNRSAIAALAWSLVLGGCGGGDRHPNDSPGGGGGAPGAFLLASPSDGASLGTLTPTLQWHDSSREDAYRVEIALDADFGSVIYTQDPIPADQTNLDVPIGVLDWDSTYFWQVVAYNVQGSTTASDSPYSFTTTSPGSPPGPFQLSLPADGTLDVPVNPTLSWTASAGVETYTLQVHDVNDFTAPPFVFEDATINGALTSFTLPAGTLQSSTLYYWRVIAVNASGETVASNANFSFTTAGAVGHWAKSYGGPEKDQALCVQSTSDGGLVVSGMTESFGTSISSAWVLKLDGDGNIEWEKAYSAVGTAVARWIEQTSDGGYVFAGSIAVAGDDEMWLVRLDASGDPVWHHAYGTVLEDGGTVVMQTSDDGFLLGGYTYSGSAGESDLKYIKVSSNGVKVWEGQLGEAGLERILALKETAAGDFVLAGRTEDLDSPDWAGFFVKIDGTNGQLLLQKKYQGSGTDYINAMEENGSGGYVFTGFTTSQTVSNIEAVWAFGTDAAGEVQWMKKYEGDPPCEGKGIRATSDGGYVIAGWGKPTMTGSTGGSVGTGKDSLLVAKIDADGNLAWEKSYGLLSGNDRGTSVDLAPGGGYVVGGWTRSYGAGKRDVWVLRLDSSGECAPLDSTGLSISAADITTIQAQSANLGFSSQPLPDNGQPLIQVSGTSATVMQQAP